MRSVLPTSLFLVQVQTLHACSQPVPAYHFHFLVIRPADIPRPGMRIRAAPAAGMI